MDGSSLLLTGRREVKHGNSSSVRQINQKFVLPPGVDVSRLATEVTAEGGLVISAPQLEDAPSPWASSAWPSRGRST